MMRIRSSLAERGLDLYETPVCVVQALLQIEALPHDIWEPACGRGAIVKPLRAAGHKVVATDLVSTDAKSPRRVSTFFSNEKHLRTLNAS
jgi:hypothetical protein